MDKKIMIAGGVGIVGLIGYYVYSHFSGSSDAGATDSIYTDTSAYGAMPNQYSSGGGGGGSGSGDTVATPQVQILPGESAANSDDGFGAFLAALMSGQNESQQMKASDLVSVINAQGSNNLMSQVANNLPWGGSFTQTANGFSIDNSPGIYVNDQNNSTWLLGGLINALGGTGGTGTFGTDGKGGGNIVITKPTTTGTPIPSTVTGKNQNQLIVDSFYKSIGNYNADAEGSAYWAGQLSSGKTVDQVQTAFYNSANTVKNQVTTTTSVTGNSAAATQGTMIQNSTPYVNTPIQNTIKNYFQGQIDFTPSASDKTHKAIA